MGLKEFFRPSPLQEKINQGITNLWNDVTGRTSAQLAEKNLSMQQEQFDYQKELNQLQMEREDTAYQRAVKDARQAGLSALSVSGGASAGSMSSAPAPQQQDTSSGFMQGINALQTLTQFIQNARQANLTADLTRAQINAQNAKANLNNQQASSISLKDPLTRDILNEQLLDLRRRGSFADWSNDMDRQLYRLSYIDKLNKHSFNQTFGFFNGMTDQEKVLNLKHKDNSKAVYPFIFDQFFSENGIPNIDSVNKYYKGLITSIPNNYQSDYFASNLESLNAIATSEIAPFLDYMIKILK